MKKLILKCCFYFLVILIALEGLVRIFHLAKDNPSRYLDKYKVEKWKPNQSGYSVTGNRRQNFSAYNINSFGFNSYREFTPSATTFEMALIGDSFIQGFHQNYRTSIGKKIEKQLSEVTVYEFGYAGYDYADQMHLIFQYKNIFDLIDKTVIYINFEDDLRRPLYKVTNERLQLEKGFSSYLKKSKLVVYAQSIGFFSAVKSFIRKVFELRSKNKQIVKKDIIKLNIEKQEKQALFIKNFESLNKAYGYNKQKHTLLLDTQNTPKIFIEHLQKEHYSYIDYRPLFNASSKSKTLIYDQHWNNHGRALVAGSILDYFKSKEQLLLRKE